MRPRMTRCPGEEAAGGADLDRIDERFILRIMIQSTKAQSTQVNGLCSGLWALFFDVIPKSS